MTPPPTRVRRLLALGGLVAILVLIQWRFGRVEAMRAWGIGVIVLAVAFTCARRIPIGFDNRPFAALTGWRKAYALVPAYAIGIVVSAFPHATLRWLDFASFTIP